jgi:hypothetical protein
VIMIDTSSHETVLHTFTGGNDGGFPQAGLIMDTTGNLYGTTVTGGGGTVFELVLPHGVSSSGTTCNGQDNGTFHGNITVSAGQNCQFFGGAIIGNVNGTNATRSAEEISIVNRLVACTHCARVCGSGETRTDS